MCKYSRLLIPKNVIKVVHTFLSSTEMPANSRGKCIITSVAEMITVDCVDVVAGEMGSHDTAMERKHIRRSADETLSHRRSKMLAFSAP